MATVGIVGLGVVGGAIHSTYKRVIDANPDAGVRLLAYDKYKGIGSIEEVLPSDVLFICVPTLSDEEGNQDQSNLREVIGQLADLKFAGTVAIKSTVTPTTSQSLADQYPDLTIVHQPEFLRAVSAEQDFATQETALLGYTKSPFTVLPVRDALQFIRPQIQFQIAPAACTEMAKYMANVFLACKVSIFNEFYESTKRWGVDFAKSYEMAFFGNPLIGPSHMQVPGPDGHFGFGGTCFPKDTRAYLKWASEKGFNSPTVRAALGYNNEIRGGHP